MATSCDLGLMLGHQFTEQLPKATLSAILKNVQTWVLFGLRGHLAWKYALALPLYYSGFDSLVLSEFRAHLIDGDLEMQ